MELILALQRFASPLLDQVMLAITLLGSETAYVALLVVGFVSIDARRTRTLAVFFLAGYYGNQLLKSAFATARPFEIDPAVLRDPAVIATAPGAGFPGAHAQMSATFWGLAAYYVKRRWFTLLAAALILLISLSRLYLGAHLPIDVLGGLVLGAATVALAVALERRKVALAKPLRVLLGVGVPLVLHLLWPTSHSGLLLGGLAAFLAGPELVRHDTSGPVAGRVALGLLALALVFGVLVGSSAALPEELKRLPLVSFTRYLVIAGVGTVIVPLLGRVLRLVPVASPTAAAARVGH